MKNYETIFLIRNDTTKEERDSVINKIKSYLNTTGEITESNDLGLKKLAYDIRGQQQAYYYQIYFKATCPAISELERMYRITNEILKFIVVRLEE